MMQQKYGWGSDQYSCLNNIVEHESNWKVDATNPNGGAYGIPQSLPGYKMASAGPDWRTNPATQLKWMLGYVKSPVRDALRGLAPSRQATTGRARRSTASMTERLESGPAGHGQHVEGGVELRPR